MNLTRERIGPTAHYTGYVWARNGLSHPELATPEVRAFRLLLSGFVRGRVYLHFESAQAAEAALLEAGFATARIERAAEMVGPGDAAGPGSRLAHILEASTT